MDAGNRMILVLVPFTALKNRCSAWVWGEKIPHKKMASYFPALILGSRSMWADRDSMVALPSLMSLTVSFWPFYEASRRRVSPTLEVAIKLLPKMSTLPCLPQRFGVRIFLRSF